MKYHTGPLLDKLAETCEADPAGLKLKLERLVGRLKVRGSFIIETELQPLLTAGGMAGLKELMIVQYEEQCTIVHNALCELTGLDPDTTRVRSSCGGPQPAGVCTAALPLGARCFTPNFPPF